MYQFNDPIIAINGVGGQIKEAFQSKGIENLLDLFLFLPLRYEDRSQIQSLTELKNSPEENSLEKKTIAESAKGKGIKVRQALHTVEAKLLKFQEYRKGRLLISRAKISDGSTEIDCIWFNNRFLKNTLKVGESFYFSGEWKKGQLQQATVEKIRETQLHTGRLVPIYSSLGEIKQGKLRRILKEALDKILSIPDPILENWQKILKEEPLSFGTLLEGIHFPENEEDIIRGREYLALIELAFLIQRAKQIKDQWQQRKHGFALKKLEIEAKKLPFTLTKAQKRVLQEISKDMTAKIPMNRLLVGDVGSGKTIIAFLAAKALLEAGQNVTLLVPTKILARQHFENFRKIFPEQSVSLLISSSKKWKKESKASLYIGTQAILNKITEIQPALIIFDEQQRFGVKQRTIHQYFEETAFLQDYTPHLLSMTATPIPRTLVLSIFAQLSLSYLDEMPKDRQIATTWLIPKEKEEKALKWLFQEISANKKRQKQALVVCPFIDPSQRGSLENVASVKAIFQEFQTYSQSFFQETGKKLSIALLHSRLSKTAQEKIIQAIYDKEIQIVISTPIIEVGVDLPNADIMLIQAAERFGLSSLHQLRGRVGRTGQKSYCLLFQSESNSENAAVELRQERLRQFCQEKDGLKLAEIDLQNRGAGEIFGIKQSGISQLRFASWTNQNLIANAQKITQLLSTKEIEKSVLYQYFEKTAKKELQPDAN